MGDVQLGQKVRDTVSGFEGIVVSVTRYLNECVRVGVQPATDKDGKLPVAEFFDIEQVELVDQGVRKEAPKVLARTGGPHQPPQQRAAPR